MFTRRLILTGGAGLFAGLVTPASAQLPPECYLSATAAPPAGAQRVGLANTQISHIAAQQKCPEWCWAASLEMISNAAGNPVDQVTIVTSTYGQPACLPSGVASFVGATNRTYPTASGGQATFQTDYMYFPPAGFLPTPLQFNNSHVVAALAAGNPLVYMNDHHCMVVVSADFIPGQIPNILQVSVLDPWPGCGIHTLTQAELKPTVKWVMTPAGPTRVTDPGGKMIFLGIVRVS